MSHYETNKAPDPVGLYPHARKVGSFLFVSGMGPRKPVTNEIPKGIEEQTKSVFENIKVVLEAADYSWDDIVDVTVFIVNMDKDFKKFNEVYAEYFKANRPTRTTVEVNKLPTPIDIELKVIAHKG